MKMYSKHNEGKSVIAERLIRTLKDKIYKYLKYIYLFEIYMYIYELDDIVNKYNKT